MLKTLQVVKNGDVLVPSFFNSHSYVDIPAELEVRHDQLKELAGATRVNAYEIIGRKVTLYWRALKVGEKRVIPISLIAAIPDTYTGPASRAYLLFTIPMSISIGRKATALEYTVVDRMLE